MRLLRCDNSGNYTLTEFSDEAIPRYAILSHTWGADEVTFEDLTNGTGKEKLGYEKIRFCGDQARKDGLQYFWIDNVCIDRSNTAELQMAVISMFRWYQNAATCYVYLSDVSAYNRNETGPSLLSWEQAFRNSRWFTRGWTLQELLAPKQVEFFDRERHFLGSKNELKRLISEITNISPDVLAGQDIRECSVAQRMSWAAYRNTTRSEDIAYSLMGIFDVNMPLLYGEGREKAFYRLQEEIMKRSDDHSIFAWELQRRYAVHGLLAPFPAAFKNSKHILSSTTLGRRTPYGLTNRGLQISLPIAENLRNDLYAAALNCVDQRTGSQLGIYLKRVGENRFVRTRLDQLPKLGLDRRARGFKPFEYRTVHVPQVPLTSYRPSHKFQFRPLLTPRVFGSGLPCPSIGTKKATMTALGICAGRRAGRVTSQLSLWPRRYATVTGYG